MRVQVLEQQGLISKHVAGRLNDFVTVRVRHRDDFFTRKVCHTQHLSIDRLVVRSSQLKRFECGTFLVETMGKESISKSVTGRDLRSGQRFGIVIGQNGGGQILQHEHGTLSTGTLGPTGNGDHLRNGRGHFDRSFSVNLTGSPFYTKPRHFSFRRRNHQNIFGVRLAINSSYIFVGIGQSVDNAMPIRRGGEIILVLGGGSFWPRGVHTIQTIGVR
mmetsp:Transcript_14996/g.30936  ORF Transcript_14996/g.30936 Transcript_14996/m.30936 type:complete len:217 (-) Transcript_14996:1109-1759(-)